jgi:hypothetical protein
MALTADVYIAPNGNDADPGTRAKPLASLEAARDAVRKLRQDGKLPKHGVTIWLCGGDYVRTKSLELTAADSGTPGAPIVWRAYKGDLVRLLGGRNLSGRQPVSDAGVLARLDRKARDHVRQIDLGALGITNFGQMKSRGFSRPTTPAHCEIFFDGKPMVLARWPNEGQWEQIAGFPEASAQDDSHGGKIGRLEDGFFYNGDRPRRWKDTSDVWVHGYWSFDWANSYERVASLDLARRFIKTAAPYGLYGFRKGQRFCFLNVIEELDKPGEWFLDRKTAMLYFWPPKAAEHYSPILISLLDRPLVRLGGASHVAFVGIYVNRRGMKHSRRSEIRGSSGF